MGAARAYAAPGATKPLVTPTAIKREVDAALRHVADTVARLPEPYLVAIAPVLDAAQRETTDALAHWLATHGKDGADRFTAQHLRQAQLQLRAALIHAEKRVQAQLTAVLTGMGPAVGRQAMKDLQLEVSAMAGAFGHSVRPIQLHQAAILAEGRSQLIPRFRNSANRYGHGIADDIRNQLAIGVAKGETFDQLTTRLVKHGGPRGLVALRGSLGDPNVVAEHIGEGLFRRYRGWAERVVRTEVSHAYNVHALASLRDADQADPGYMKRWDSTLDRLRTCAVCRGLDGIAVALDDSFPGGFAHAPAHPNCLCTITPWRPEWGKPAGNGNQAPPPNPPPAPPPTPPKPAPAKPPRAQNRKAPTPTVAPPPSAPATPPPHQRAVDAMAARDFTTARHALEEDLAGEGFVAAPASRGGQIVVEPLPRHIGGLHNLLSGKITIAPHYAASARSFAAQVAGTATPTHAAAEGMHVLVHEVVHGSNVLGVGEYRGVSALIEEVSTETSARWYMRERYGRSVSLAYQGEIDLVRRAVEISYNVGTPEAAELVEKASLAFRKVGGAPRANAHGFVATFARGFPSGAGRGTLERFLLAYNQRTSP